MLGLLIVPLSEIKSYVVVLSFYKKMMKQRTLPACSLRYSIKKGMFSVKGKLDLFKLDRGESSGLILEKAMKLKNGLTGDNNKQ